MLRKFVTAFVCTIAALWLALPAAANERSVALIMDASGSMRGALPDGVLKIDAAKSAVGNLVREIPDDVRLSFRAYGHQSHRRKKDCKDTQFLVPFDAAAANRGAVAAQAEGLKAQGYTPISLVLGLAADDVKPEAGEHVIVLVSDGKETCEGDPCVLAKKLADADAGLSIHTIGFGADYQAQQQLKCIAKVARGQYFDANSADELAHTLQEAATAELAAEELVIKKSGPGILAVENGQYHDVFNAETGEKVGTIGTGIGQVELPAGIYNVQFGDALLWKSVEVISGETTLLRPGTLRIGSNQFHEVRDSETGESLAAYGNSTSFLTLPPGRFDVSFGDAVWRSVEIAEAAETYLEPAILKIANNDFHTIVDVQSGEKAGSYTSSSTYLPLPPGVYDVMFEKAPWRVELEAANEHILTPGGVATQPMGFHTIYFPDGEKAATLATGEKQQMLPPGDYLIGIDKQRVPFTVSENKILTIKLE